MGQTSFESQKAFFGLSDSKTLEALSFVRRALGAHENFEQAETVFRHVLMEREVVLELDNSATIFTTCDLGLALRNQGKVEEAEEMY